MMAEGFDDGRADVPLGAAEPVERVVVVGAGIAGLTVANALAHGGVECVVVEARDRIGGRLDTVDLAGSPVDLGGSWIHTPVGNPMRAFARQAGVPCRSANPLPELAGFDCGEAPVIGHDAFGAGPVLVFHIFHSAAGRVLAATDGFSAAPASTSAQSSEGQRHDQEGNLHRHRACCARALQPGHRRRQPCLLLRHGWYRSSYRRAR